MKLFSFRLPKLDKRGRNERLMVGRNGGTPGLDNAIKIIARVDGYGHQMRL